MGEDKVHCITTETCHISQIYDSRNLIYNNNTMTDRIILTGIYILFYCTQHEFGLITFIQLEL